MPNHCNISSTFYLFTLLHALSNDKYLWLQTQTKQFFFLLWVLLFFSINRKIRSMHTVLTFSLVLVILLEIKIWPGSYYKEYMNMKITPIKTFYRNEEMKMILICHFLWKNLLLKNKFSWHGRYLNLSSSNNIAERMGCFCYQTTRKAITGLATKIVATWYMDPGELMWLFWEVIWLD